MQYRTISQTDSGRSDIIVVDDFQTPFNLGIAAKITDGSPTYSIEFSLDDPYAAGYDKDNALWFPVADLSSESDDAAAALTIPCRAISIYLGEGVTGTVEAKVVQAGPA